MTRSVDAALEAALRRDRRVTLACLAAVIALAWAYLLGGAGMEMSALEMTRASQSGAVEGMPGMAMTKPALWTPGYALLMFFMWWIMMVAMMLPSAAPAILLFATINRRQRDSGLPHVAAGSFALGYVAAWALFSAIATILQWNFERSGLLSGVLVGQGATFGGTLLLAAGLYQLTPLKHACLRHCRSPLAFLASRWRPGARGALRMGIDHGAYCVGCCWFLMGLLFFGGVMNLYWIVGLALFVLLEKLVPAGHWLGYATGVVLIGWGVGTLAV